VLQVTLPDDLMSALEILQFITVVDCYPNVSIAYWILLTIPVTVALAERSFFKLKLLKNYLRSTMSQERLNGLATCSIEKDILANIDLNIVLNDFASRNAGRSYFFLDVLSIHTIYNQKYCQWSHRIFILTQGIHNNHTIIVL
jgi:hypothetical protein